MTTKTLTKAAVGQMLTQAERLLYAIMQAPCWTHKERMRFRDLIRNLNDFNRMNDAQGRWSR